MLAHLAQYLIFPHIFIDLLGPHNGKCYGIDDSVATWVSSVCLTENECLNGNHLCKENETCEDQARGYECKCSPGYKRK